MDKPPRPGLATHSHLLLAIALVGAFLYNTDGRQTAFGLGSIGNGVEAAGAAIVSAF
jgi:hypothetical protein